LVGKEKGTGIPEVGSFRDLRYAVASTILECSGATLKSCSMRLTPTEIREIRSCAKRHFGEGATVRLFGSRTNDARHGGDIDLHIEAERREYATLANELKFCKELREHLGDQRIDVVVRAPSYEPRAIDEIAVETGMVLS
jgi:predicted nucleotidyltransferase